MLPILRSGFVGARTAFSVLMMLACALFSSGCRTQAPPDCPDETRHTDSTHEAARALGGHDTTSVDNPGETEEIPAPIPEVPVDRRMAITVDDLPVADFGRYSKAGRRSIIEKWCRTIRTRELPVTGFFIMRYIDKHPELAGMWREAGVTFGNHTWSHPKLRQVGLSAYLADLQKGHDALVELLPEGTTIPFRYPYLYQGFEADERDVIRARLKQLNSPYAPVTIDTQDWLYARGYTEAKKAGDELLTRRYYLAWRWNLEESTLRAEWWARELFGREPPQILLIHGNELNADHLGEYLDWARDRGYRFITLEEALQDTAYQEPDSSLSPTGDSFWLRVYRTRRGDPSR